MNEVLSFDYRPYARSFRRPLKTAHGLWSVREGVLIRVENAQGQIAYGECAPLTAFGTETQQAALEALQRLDHHVPSREQLDALEKQYPCLRSAFDMALYNLQGIKPQVSTPLTVTALLSADFVAIEELDRFYKAGYRHFKWKLTGKEPVKENALFTQLYRILPEDASLRVDANGCLDEERTRQWLRFLDGKRVAWLEQPMAPEHLGKMRLLSHEFSTPIALDESVARVDDLETICKARWRGLCVVKPSIMGSRERFLKLREQHTPKLIYSTAFETSIGLQALIELAASDPHPQKESLGLGGENYFTQDTLCLHSFGAQMGVWPYSSQDFEPLWNACAKG